MILKLIANVVSINFKTEINLNKGTSDFYVNAELNHMNTTKYTHEVLKGDNNTNISHNIQITPIDELVSVDTSNKIKEHTGIYYNTPQSGYNKYDYII